MRQVGVLAAAGIYALDHVAPKLQVDHANAQILAKGQARVVQRLDNAIHRVNHFPVDKCQ